MKAVIQRVRSAAVNINGKTVSEIDTGFLVLLGIKVGDTDKDLAYITKKIINLRVFEDDIGKLNLSVNDVGGAILLVSQFTLLGDARKGNRPSFTEAAKPTEAIPLYQACIEELKRHCHVETGVFGADMQVSLVNDGPVTILLDSRE